MSTPDGDVVHVEAVSLLAGRSGMSLVTSVNKYQWVLALPWFIILLVVSSVCIPRENQLGVDQAPGQRGSEYKSVIFCEIFYELVFSRKMSVNKNSQG